jgi:hypothetical protein
VLCCVAPASSTSCSPHHLLGDALHFDRMRVAPGLYLGVDPRSALDPRSAQNLAGWHLPYILSRSAGDGDSGGDGQSQAVTWPVHPGSFLLLECPQGTFIHVDTLVRKRVFHAQQLPLKPPSHLQGPERIREGVLWSHAVGRIDVWDWCHLLVHTTSATCLLDAMCIH